jgi:probable FeS assembly SUF system protein SufT
MDKLVAVTRECAALQIPSAEKVTLLAGSYVRILQALGGTYTVLTDQGVMVRVDGKDADALGEKPPEAKPALEPGTPLSREEQVWEQLRTCYDPEIPVNIVDLGLVYECHLEKTDAGEVARIKFTLTAPGCGMGDVLKADIESKVRGVPGIADAQVEVVFDPPWDREMMSEAARLQLGMF